MKEKTKTIENTDNEDENSIEETSTQKKKKFNFVKEIKFIPRTEFTNTHRNPIDDHIESLSTWKINHFRKSVTILLYFLSFGILFLLTFIFPTIILKLYCNKDNPENSDYILITDYDHKKYLCCLNSHQITSINPVMKMKKDMQNIGLKKNSRYVTKDYQRFLGHNIKNIYFIFKNVRYIYNYDNCSFSCATFNLNQYKNKEILDLFDKNCNISSSSNSIDNAKTNSSYKKSLRQEEKEGAFTPNVAEYNYLLNLYGKNEVLNESTKLSSIILNKFFSLFNLFSLLCIIIWLLSGNIVFALIILLLITIVLLISIRDTYIVSRKIYELDKEESVLSNEDFSKKNSFLRYNYNIPKSTLENELLINDLEYLAENFKKKHNTLKSFKSSSFTSNYYVIDTNTSIRYIHKDLPEYIENIHQSWSIVPGEVLKIKPGHKILFDGLLLNGYCTVDESELTGETNEVYKTQLPYNNENFKYMNSKNHFLFQGTVIKQCINENNNEIIRVLVINTGMNTQRGNLLLNLCFPKNGNYSFYKDVKIFMAIMFIICIISIFIKLGLNNINISYYFKDITIILPPTLIIVLTYSSLFYRNYLEQKKVHCVDKDKIIAAGKANVIILDKTGTLTENEFDLYGYQFTLPEEFGKYIYEEPEPKDTKSRKSIKGGLKKKFRSRQIMEEEGQKVILSKLETSSKVLNKMHQTFWKNFSITMGDLYKEDPKYNIIYFAECLGCCHNIEKFEDKNLGDAIDIKMFESSNWMIQIEEDKKTNQIYKYVMPSNIYKITEKTFFNNLKYNLEMNKKNNNNKNTHIQNISQYKILIEKIYPFNSENQITAVITKNLLDKSRRIYIKGAPEKLLDKCTNSSKPENINKLIMELTKQGLRVIACATRLLDQEKEEYKFYNKNYSYKSLGTFDENSKNNSSKSKDINPIYKESELIFLGLVIFKNPLKKDTQSVIEKLYDAKFKLIMSTGDNECTSYYVAQESKMINNEIQTRYVIDLKLDINLLYMIEINCDIDDLKKDSISENKKLLFDNLFNKPKDKYLENNNCLDDVDKILRKKEAIVNVSGAALSYIIDQLKNNTDIYIDISKKCTKKNIENLIRKFGCIFYRMTPKNKAELIQFFKQDKKSIVIMCGDGSNDIPAILESDIGVSINQKSDMQILSHFYMKNSSIKCVELIVKTGRACFECNEILFKVMIIHGLIKNISILLLKILNISDYNTYQLVFLDTFCSLLPLLCSVRTAPGLILAKDVIGTSLFNKKFFLSTILHIIVNLIDLICFYNLLKRNIYYELEIHRTKKLIFTNLIFVFVSFTFLLTIFAINTNSIHRKHYTTNSIYSSVILFLIMFLMGCLYYNTSHTLRFIKNFVELEDGRIDKEFTKQHNVIALLFFIFLNFIVIMSIENFIAKKL